MKFGLGTVQFGLPYGATNREGQVSQAVAGEMLRLAWARGIDLLDTAAAYGNSESVLGQLADPSRPFRLISKTLPLTGEIGQTGLEAVAQAFNNSLTHLKVDCLDAVLVHHANNLLGAGGEHLYRLLMDWQEAGQVRRIGVSVYTGDELERLLAKYRLDLVQLPLNVFDQRLPKAGWIARLHEAGIEVHARSLFLQGVLLAAPDSLPLHLQVLAPQVADFQQSAAIQGLSPAAACLAYAAAQGIDYGIIGALNVNQLAALCDAHGQAAAATGVDWSRFALDDESLINPARWSRPC